MPRSASRAIGWIALSDFCLVLLIIGFDLLLVAMKIPMRGHPALTFFLGPHGLLFNLILPGLIVLLIPLGIAWGIAFLVSSFKR